MSEIAVVKTDIEVFVAVHGDPDNSDLVGTVMPASGFPKRTNLMASMRQINLVPIWHSTAYGVGVTNEIAVHGTLCQDLRGKLRQMDLDLIASGSLALSSA